MNDEVRRWLRCPVCASGAVPNGLSAPVTGSARVLRCPAGHSFDVARQGYVNLVSGGTPHSGDSADMIGARGEFLTAGHYDFVPAALAEAARTPYQRMGGGLVVDVGAGTGHHLAALLEALPGTAGLALDVSKPALRRAARAHPRVAAALCDAWGRLPVADGAAALVTNVFAPRNGAEFHRILRPEGMLLLVTPAPEHLGELVGRLGLLRVDPDKPARVAASLQPWFIPGASVEVRRELALRHAEVAAVVAMGPSAWHGRAEATRLADLPEPITVTASVLVSTWLPRAQVERSISSQPTGGS